MFLRSRAQACRGRPRRPFSGQGQGRGIPVGPSWSPRGAAGRPPTAESARRDCPPGTSARPPGRPATGPAASRHQPLRGGGLRARGIFLWIPLEASAPADVRQQKGGRRASPPAPAPGKLAAGEPAAGGAAAGTPPGAGRPGTHRGVWTRPARSRCHRPAPARKSEPAAGSPPPLSARRRAERQQVKRHQAKNTGARRSPRLGWAPARGPRRPPARQPLVGPLHFLPILASDAKGNAERSPETRPLRPSPAARARGGPRPAAAGGRRTRPGEVRSPTLHGAPALPLASPTARVSGPRGRRRRPGRAQQRLFMPHHRSACFQLLQRVLRCQLISLFQLLPGAARRSEAETRICYYASLIPPV